MEVQLGLSTAGFWLGNGPGPGEEKGCNFCLTIAGYKNLLNLEISKAYSHPSLAFFGIFPYPAVWNPALFVQRRYISTYFMRNLSSPESLFRRGILRDWKWLLNAPGYNLSLSLAASSPGDVFSHMCGWSPSVNLSSTHFLHLSNEIFHTKLI